MQRSKAMSHKTSPYFEIHKTFYLIKINFFTKKKTIKITVQVNNSNQIYFIHIYQQTLPRQLAFYGSLDNVYLALQKSLQLSFNIQDKCFQFQDLINNKPRKIRLAMKKRRIGLIKKHDKNPKKSKSFKGNQEEIKQLKLRYNQAQKNIEALRSIMKQSRRQVQIRQDQLKAERLKIQEIQMQNEQLRQHCRFFKRNFPEYIKEFDIFMKRRKDSDNSCFKAQSPSAELSKEMIIQEQSIEIHKMNEIQYSQDSFILQIDQAQFKKTFKSKN